jgi:hypothetical protein
MNADYAMGGHMEHNVAVQHNLVATYKSPASSNSIGHGYN